MTKRLQPRWNKSTDSIYTQGKNIYTHTPHKCVCVCVCVCMQMPGGSWKIECPNSGHRKIYIERECILYVIIIYIVCVLIYKEVFITRCSWLGIIYTVSAALSLQASCSGIFSFLTIKKFSWVEFSELMSKLGIRYFKYVKVQYNIL